VVIHAWVGSFSNSAMIVLSPFFYQGENPPFSIG